MNAFAAFLYAVATVALVVFLILVYVEVKKVGDLVQWVTFYRDLSSLRTTSNDAAAVKALLRDAMQSHSAELCNLTAWGKQIDQPFYIEAEADNGGTPGRWSYVDGAFVDVAGFTFTNPSGDTVRFKTSTSVSGLF